MRIFLKKFHFTFLVIVFFIICTPITYSYLSTNHGYPIPRIAIRNACSDAYTPTFNASLAAWNNATPVVNLTESSESPNFVKDSAYADSWVGCYSYSYNPKDGTTLFNIRLNTSILDTKSSNYRQSVLVHELGHALSLADNPPTSPSIMRYDRNRELIYVPQADDIHGVNVIYQNK